MSRINKLGAAPSGAQTAPLLPVRLAMGFAFAAILFAGLVAYHNSFSVPFLFDDDDSIKNNPTIRSLWQAWLPPAGRGVTVSGRPLLNFSLALNYAVSGREVWSYHVLNFVIHVCTGLILFGVVRRTLLQPVLAPRFGRDAMWLALTVALLWTVHPLQTESVTYIVQRAESLVGLFYLLTMWCFIRAVGPSAAGGWKLLAVLCCLLGMSAKEVMVTAPVLVALYDRIFVAAGWREVWARRKGFHLALAGTWLLLAGLLLSTGNRGGTAGLGTASSFNYGLTQVGAVVHYLRLAFWPSPLIFDYGQALVTEPKKVLFSALVLVPLVAVSIGLAWRGRPVGFCGIFFFGVLAPSSSIVPVVTQTMAEHRMYLPLAAVVGLTVTWLYTVLGRKSGMIFALWFVALTAATVRRNSDYRSTRSIWEDTVAKWPDEARARSNLGASLISEQIRRAEGIRYIEQAIRLSPNDPKDYSNLGWALSKTPGRHLEALAVFEKALALNPDLALVHVNLGVALHQIPGRQTEAVAHLKKALQLEPDMAFAHAAFGQVLLDFPERRKEAIFQLEEAVRLNPDDPEAQGNLATAICSEPGRLAEAADHLKTALGAQNCSEVLRYNLGALLAKISGRKEEAVHSYQAALKVQPDYWEAHYSLGMLLLDLTGRKSEAIPHLEIAARLVPDNPGVRTNLGFALGDIPDRLEDATREFAAVVRLQPDAADAHFNYGTALLRLTGHEQEAIEQFQAVLTLNPTDADAHNNLGLLFSGIPAQAETARQHFEAALRLKPDLADAHFNLAKMDSTVPGRIPEAIRQLEAALKLVPDYEPAKELLVQLTAQR